MNARTADLLSQPRAPARRRGVELELLDGQLGVVGLDGRLDEGGVEGVDAGQNHPGQGSGQEHHADRPGDFDLGTDRQPQGVPGHLPGGTASVEAEGEEGLDLAGPVDRLRSNFINGVKHMPVQLG